MFHNGLVSKVGLNALKRDAAASRALFSTSGAVNSNFNSNSNSTKKPASSTGTVNYLKKKLIYVLLLLIYLP